MGKISDQQKLMIELLLLDKSIGYEEIQEKIGPRGWFPLAEKEVSLGGIFLVKQRIQKYGNPLHRKRRVDKGSLSFDELEALDRAMLRRSTTTTAELREVLAKMGFCYAGRSLVEYPDSLINDGMREMGHTKTKVTVEPPMIDFFEVARFHASCDLIDTVRHQLGTRAAFPGPPLTATPLLPALHHQHRRVERAEGRPAAALRPLAERAARLRAPELRVGRRAAHDLRRADLARLRHRRVRHCPRQHRRRGLLRVLPQQAAAAVRELRGADLGQRHVRVPEP